MLLRSVWRLLLVGLSLGTSAFAHGATADSQEQVSTLDNVAAAQKSMAAPSAAESGDVETSTAGPSAAASGDVETSAADVSAERAAEQGQRPDTNLEDEMAEARRRSYWEHQKVRPFVAAKAVLGAMSTAQLFAGYGRPQWIWGGVSANAFITSDMVVVSGGPQIELLLINALFRVRHVHTFARHQPALAKHYTSDDLRDNSQPRSHYTALGSSLWGFIPAGPTLGMWAVTGEYLLDFPSNNAVFSEFLRYTYSKNGGLLPQLVWWYRVAEGRYMFGPTADVALTPSRPPLLRAGGSFVARIGPHLSFQTWLTFPVAGPDQINWLTQAWGSVRFEWNWASGESHPGFL